MARTKRNYKNNYHGVVGKNMASTGIHFFNPRSKLRMNGTNGEVKIIKPADPEKLATYLETKMSG